MNEASPSEFDVCGVLPGAGVTVLEASAGTGKTFTIAALVARFVADGTPLSEILAVTFTRMATGELRDRVRERLVSAHTLLEGYLQDDEEPPPEDPVARTLAEGPTSEVRERCRRLAEALASFDEATITTTHGFCQLVLSSMGVDGGASARDTLLEDTSDLVEEVVDDLYLRRALGYGQPEFQRSKALEAAREAIRNPDTPLEPPPGDSVPGRLRRFAEKARTEFGHRLQNANLLTYDDLLVRLRDALADPERGRAACDRLAGRFKVVLVDEFQDTDPVQWDVVSSAFGGGRTVLVLIGDPKQAIYSFRGADVYAYLEASECADRRYTLGDNYRSDQGLLRAFDALMDPVYLGHPEIPYRVVRSIPGHARPGLEGAPSPAALRARVLHTGEHHDLTLTKAKNLVEKQFALEWVASDLASDVAALLSSGTELVEWDEQGHERGRRPLTPAHVAVLVRTNRHAGIVHEALRSAGVPAVVASSASVLRAPAAKTWLGLLEALEQPASRGRAVAVALGPFVGMSAEQVATADETELEQLHLRLRRLGQVLRHRGVAALFRAACIEGGVPERLLAKEDGERQMTDLAHVAELLGAEASSSQLGLPRLRAWLARKIAEKPTEDEAEERTRRLDSDEKAVQVLTVHRAKGLEFPVVYCPYMWDGGSERHGQPVVFHDPSDGNQRKLDVGSEGSTYREHQSAHHLEERGEELRLLYVALTRAKHQAVIWWARTHECQQSPLGRLLFERDEDGQVAPDGSAGEPSDTDVASKLETLASNAPGHFVVEHASGSTDTKWSPGTSGSEVLRVASFGRAIDRSWRRTSYSAITATAHEETFGSEPEAPGTVDEPARSAPVASSASPAGTEGSDAVSAEPAAPSDGGEDPLAAVCPLGGMPAGAEVGTVLHRVLELVDFASPDLEADLSAALSAEVARHGVSLGPPEIVVAGLASAIRTSLGPSTGDAALADAARADRLDELDFEFPIGGGDSPAGPTVTTAALAEVLARHERPGDPLFGYGERLAGPMLEGSFRGYLTGSIDLVLRRGAGGGARFFVVDYKSNRLAPFDEELLAWHYRPEALDAEMRRFHYPLQALLYLVALHRYLRWRMSGYDPERNLGGALYLFLRGMLGPSTPRVDGRPCGVFAWTPPAALVTEVSDLLDEGSGGTEVRAS
ncbi:MAG TPA: UvrD-helicase domain-containing protein [Acidimicrobiales bacterium]|nr:UvrD-helicase domain-containing protein [Acidimicrobiales bacterium]